MSDEQQSNPVNVPDASAPPFIDRRSPDSVGAALRGTTQDGLYRPEGQVYHGTSRAYDTIRLPDADSDMARHGMDEYGRGFYAAFDPQSAVDAKDYAARYAEGAGLVVEGSLDRRQAFLNLESPLGQGLSQQLRAQLSSTNTGNPDLDRYYRDVAAQIESEMPGREAWDRMTGVQGFEQWQRQQSTVEMDRATASKLLRADRSQLRANLETHGIDLSEISALDEPQAQRVQESLRALNTDNPIMQRYFNEVADQVRPGMDTEQLTKLLMSDVGVQRTAASMVTPIDADHIAALMDGHSTQVLSSIGADGVYIPSQQTLVFKGQSAIDRLPELRLAEIVGTGPVSSHIHTDRPLVVGEVMILAGAAHRSDTSAIDTSPEAYGRATTPQAREAILRARLKDAPPSVPDRSAPFPAPDQFGRSKTPRNGLSTDPTVFTEASWREGAERLPPLDMDGLQSQLRREGLTALEEAGMTRTPPEAFGRRAVDDAGVAAANEPRNAESVRTASQPDTMPARGGASTGLPRVAGGAVAGMSAYMIAQKVGPNGTLGEDVRHGGTRAALASASLAADTTAAVADVAEVTGKAKGALGALARRATPVAVVAGAMEFGTAISAKDGHRAANAAGATAGGILGGIAAGASAGFVMGTVFPGAGNVAGAVVGGAVGLIGGIAGAIGGGALTEAVAGDALDAHLNNRAAGDDWRSKQAKAAQERQREAAAKSGQVHRSFAGRAGAQHLNQELGEIAGQFASTNWGKHIGNGDKNVTAQELRQEMQQHGITVAEIDRNRDGNITGKEMTDALNAHGVQHDRGNPQQAPARTAPPRDWRAEQAKAAQERQREAAAQSGKVHSSFAGRAGAQHLNAELKGLEGELTKAGWGRLIGNGDANVTVAELRTTMQKHGITVAEIDRNGDGNITGREVTNALKGHGIGNGQRSNGGQGR